MWERQIERRFSLSRKFKADLGNGADGRSDGPRQRTGACGIQAKAAALAVWRARRLTPQSGLPPIEAVISCEAFFRITLTSDVLATASR